MVQLNRKAQSVGVPLSMPLSSWELELEKSRSKYHIAAAWVGIIFDPVFSITDYFNIPASWSHLLAIRLSVSAITLVALLLRRYVPSHFIVLVPFTLISLQNAYTFSLIGEKELLGHNLNYMALWIAASMFVAWNWQWSALVIFASGLATSYFVFGNPVISANEFFVDGGLLLAASSLFMGMLIKTRHDLTVKEIKARIALELSNAEIQTQNIEIKAQNQEIQLRGEEIKAINENLEALVNIRTAEIEKKNKALEEYAFINAHKLRSPVASILGLVNLLRKSKLSNEDQSVIDHLQQSADSLDNIVSSITKALERGDKK